MKEGAQSSNSRPLRLGNREKSCESGRLGAKLTWKDMESRYVTKGLLPKCTFYSLTW